MNLMKQVKDQEKGKKEFTSNSHVCNFVSEWGFISISQLWILWKDVYILFAAGEGCI